MYFLNSPRKKTLFSSALIACYMPLAYADFSFQELAPFVGAEYGRSRSKLKEKYGGEIFRPNVTNYNFFAGIDLRQFFNNDMFGVGLELGYTRDNNRRDKQSLEAANHMPGVETALGAAAAPQIYSTSNKIRHKYLGVTAKYALFECLDITALLGLSLTTVKAQHTLTDMPGRGRMVHQREADINANFWRRSYKKSNRLLPMARLGLQYELNKNFALRANATWIRTSKISINSDKNRKIPPRLRRIIDTKIKFKNSIRYSVGVVVNFL